MRRDVTAGDDNFAFSALLSADLRRKNCNGLFGGTAPVSSNRPPELLHTLLQAEDCSATTVSSIQEASSTEPLCLTTSDAALYKSPRVQESVVHVLRQVP